MTLGSDLAREVTSDDAMIDQLVARLLQSCS